MSKATLTSKGQITVPREIREELGLRAGDKLLFEMEGGAIRLKVSKPTPLEELRGSLPARGEYPGKEVEREGARRSVGSRMLGESV